MTDWLAVARREFSGEPLEEPTPKTPKTVRACSAPTEPANPQNPQNQVSGVSPVGEPKVPGKIERSPERPPRSVLEKLLVNQGERLFQDRAGVWVTLCLETGKRTAQYRSLDELASDLSVLPDYPKDVWPLLPRQSEPAPQDPPGLPSLEERCRCLEQRLLEQPWLDRAFDIQGGTPKPEPGPPVSVVLAVRTPEGIVTGELLVPRERFDAVAIFNLLETPLESSASTGQALH